MTQALSRFKFDYTPAGFLRVKSIIAHSGWLRYQNSDSSERWEFLDKSVLFGEEHLDSVAGSPLTLHHPPSEVSPDNYQRYSVGSTSIKLFGNREHGTLGVILTVADRHAIEAVKNQLVKGLSCGYNVRTELRGDGKGYNQVERQNNHISLVGQPRAERALLSYS